MLSVGMFLWKPSVMVELEWPLTSEVSLLVTGLATSQASRARMISEKSAALMFLKCSCVLVQVLRAVMKRSISLYNFVSPHE